MKQSNIAIMNNLLKQALYYVTEYGWSVIPVGKDKKSLISWKEYQLQKATVQQIRDWWQTWPDANIGVITGKISNLIVIDIDPRHGGSNEKFQDIKTVCVKTGGNGYHYYFSHEDGVQSKAGIQPGIDVRGEAGYVVVPPSIHKSGTPYEWINSPKDIPIIPLPDFVKQWLRDTKSSAKQETNNKENNELFKGVVEGSRNEGAASVAGSLLSKYSKEEWVSKAWPLLKAWNLQNKPPLEEKELRIVFDSISAREVEAGDKEAGSFIKKVLTAILAKNIIFFHDQYKEGFAALQGDGKHILKIQSKEFETWVAGYVWKEFSIAISNEMLTKIIRTLECQAIFEGKQYTLHNRIVHNGFVA